MTGGARLLAVILVLMPVAAGAAHADYSGWRSCAPCHEKSAEGWRTTRHSKALDSLAAEKKERNRTCLPCHTTGFGEPGGFLDIDITPEFAGVQCESCHGPAGSHLANPEQKKPATSPKESVCRKCHTPGQDSAFDYKSMSSAVHGAVKAVEPPGR